MIRQFLSLRFLGPVFLVIGFGCGALSGYLWYASNQSWKAHLNAANQAGRDTLVSMRFGSALPETVTEYTLDLATHLRANTGEFQRIKDVPQPPLDTLLSLVIDAEADLPATNIRIAIISSSLRYPVSELGFDENGQSNAALGEVFELIAKYCSDAVFFAKLPEQRWRRFESTTHWSCASRPTDHRLLAAVIAIISLVILSSFVGTASSQLQQLSQRLGSRQSLGGSDDFQVQGFVELRDIVEALNLFRTRERHHLNERALVLSGVSHDLGTPATRLKLRTELIGDPDLRQKFESDIDQMTQIIESVLTYTRAELSSEEPRPLSLSSLVEAAVADYADMNKPVYLDATRKITVEGGHSIFMSRRGRGEVTEDQQIVVSARPIALQRAISNLIDNALKYGRKANVRLETDPTFIHILIEDGGGHRGDLDFKTLTAPFRRGQDTDMVQGFGMGLTIASTIAHEHGGDLSFEQGPEGIVARLKIRRQP